MSENQVSPAYKKHTHLVRFYFRVYRKLVESFFVFPVCTYWTILPVLVSASALTKRHTFVSTEDEAGVADTSFHARMAA